MVGEILSVGVGGCGIKMEYDVWSQFLVEHKNSFTKKAQNNSFATIAMFEEIEENKYIPRALFVDSTESDAINAISNAADSTMFGSDHFVSFNALTHGNFALGYQSVGEQVIETIMDKMRKSIESCDKLQGFMFYRSVSGGTGSGLSALMIEKLTEEETLKKCYFYEYATYPTSHEIENEMVLYNSLLDHLYTAENVHLSLAFDNEQIRCITERYLKSYLNGYVAMNEYMSKIISGFTSPFRFDSGYLNIGETYLNLIQFPLCHYLVSAFAPLERTKYHENKTDKRQLLIDAFCRETKLAIGDDINTMIYQRYCDYFEAYTSMEQIRIKYGDDVQAITALPLMYDNMSIKIVDETPDVELRRYMALALNYRGDIPSKCIQAAIVWIKSSGMVQFCEWGPTGFKCAIHPNNTPQRESENCFIKEYDKNATMVGNNTMIMNFFRKRMIDPYKALQARNSKKYQHLYTQHGIEPEAFQTAQQQLEMLYSDYREILCEDPTDDEDEDSD
eukprot:665368_1